MAVDKYRVVLKDKYRPPSCGGNTRAWHRHELVVGGEKYSFLAAWSGKFVFKNETVSFDWDWDTTGQYRNVDRASVLAFTAAGVAKHRGERGNKVWRTADARPPGRRSEWED